MSAEHAAAAAEAEAEFVPPSPWEALPANEQGLQGWAIRVGVGRDRTSICAVLAKGDGSVYEVHSVSPQGQHYEAIELLSAGEEVLAGALADLRAMG